MPRIIVLTVFLLTKFFAYAQGESVDERSKNEQDSLQIIASNLEPSKSLTISGNNNETKDLTDTKEINNEKNQLIKGLISKPEKIAEFISISLVDKQFYSDFDNGVELLKENYDNQEVLITVATDFSEQRIFFISEFYTQMSTGKTEYEAYNEALILTKKVFKKLDFKFYFLKPKS